MTEQTCPQEPMTTLLLSVMSDGVLGLDLEKRISMTNRAAQILLGWSEDELVGQKMHALLQSKRKNGSTYPENESPLAWLDNGGGFHLVEDILWRKDGSFVEVEMSGIQLSQPDSGIYSVILFNDISEQKDNQASLLKAFQDRDSASKDLENAHSQLLQSEKMASIGQLAAGVAHEINNPIGFIGSNLGSLKGQVEDLMELIETYMRAEPALAAHVDIMATIEQVKSSIDFKFLQEDVQNLITESLEGVNRVKKIVDNLKDFSRLDAAEWHFTNLEHGLESTLNIVWNEIKYKAEVKKDYAGLPEIECIASQINQVFMNLLVNAAHAIEKHGTITLQTGFDNDTVWVSVSDTGIGIKPEHLTKIFDPFFTTKPVGQGTGLGLSLAYGIVQRHHGRLVVCSEVGEGTTFRLTLPRVRVIDADKA